MTTYQILTNHNQMPIFLISLLLYYRLIIVGKYLPHPFIKTFDIFLYTALCRIFVQIILLLVPPTELEIFKWELVANALLFHPPTELEIFQQYLVAKALLLVPPTELKYFNII